MKLSRTGALIALCLSPGLAHATLDDVYCDDTTRLTERLLSQNGTRMGQGLRDPETVLEIWRTSESGDWVVVQTYTNGTSCIVAMGAHWSAFLPDKNPA